MRTRWMVLVAIAILMPGKIWAQEANSTATVVVLNEKSPTTAGLLSGLVFPGAGSFYAGNSGHGVRHLAIGLLAAAGLTVGSDNCSIVFDTGHNSCRLFWASLGVGVVNLVWSITTASGDAKEYNRVQRVQHGVELAPEVVAIRVGGRTAVGLQVAQLRF